MKTTQKQLNELYKQYFQTSELRRAILDGRHDLGTYDANREEADKALHTMKTIANLITK